MLFRFVKSACPWTSRTSRKDSIVFGLMDHPNRRYESCSTPAPEFLSVRQPTRWPVLSPTGSKDGRLTSGPGSKFVQTAHLTFFASVISTVKLEYAMRYMSYAHSLSTLRYEWHSLGDV